jgi:phosphoribosylanthranilate isomerase
VNRVRVKVCGLRTANAVDAAIEAGADAVGFVFAESPRRVSIDDAARLLARVPAFVARVGVFRHPTEEDVIEALEALPLDLVQTDADDFDEGAACVPEAMRLPVVREGDRIEVRMRDALESARTILVEGPRSGTGERLSLDAIGALPRDSRARMIIAGGLSHENVAEAISRVLPFGVDVSSGVERSRGEKDPKLIHQFLRAVREAERAIP